MAHTYLGRDYTSDALPAGVQIFTTVRPCSGHHRLSSLVSMCSRYLAVEVAVQKATFAAGCFWGVETAFRKIEGVVDVAVGYMGGGTENPTYKEVCIDQTGHAEVVQVDFDPDKVSYPQLLDTFWQCHDPTQLNRQGPDVGTQYRSAIFFHSPEQESEAAAAKEQLAVNGKYSQPVATLVKPAAEFYRAEEYHQQYLAKRGMGSCHI